MYILETDVFKPAWIATDQNAFSVISVNLFQLQNYPLQSMFWGIVYAVLLMKKAFLSLVHFENGRDKLIGKHVAGHLLSSCLLYFFYLSTGWWFSIVVPVLTLTLLSSHYRLK